MAIWSSNPLIRKIYISFRNNFKITSNFDREIILQNVIVNSIIIATEVDANENQSLLQEYTFLL